MLTSDMLAVLCCPTCRSDVRAEVEEFQEGAVGAGSVICDSCGSRYPVLNGVPNLVPAHVLEDEHWQQWRKHLDVFQARREFRRRDPTSVVHRLGRGSRTQQAFAEFAAIRGGKVLDLGCGPGRFRWHLDADRVEYYGLDPIPLPEAGAFRFVRALAEHIPFKTHVFSHVVVLSAMDHFLDLEAVFKEIHRVLRPDGRVHVLQSVHDVRRPVKLISHLVKDFVEDFLTARKKAAAPHHMTEFSLASLCGTLGSHFALERQERYSRAWYSPDKVFTSSAVLQDQT